MSEHLPGGRQYLYPSRRSCSVAVSHCCLFSYLDGHITLSSRIVISVGMISGVWSEEFSEAGKAQMMTLGFKLKDDDGPVTFSC